MFFKDDLGINVIQFGAGDIEVAAGLIDSPKETIGCVSLISQKSMPIGGKAERAETDNAECKLDTFAHTRMVFTDIKSIDVVIEYLQKAKSIMIGDAI